MRNWFALPVVFSLLVLMPLTMIAQEAAQTPEADSTEVDGSSAYVRVVHFSPDTPAVDVFANDQPTGIEGVEYGGASQWVSVPAGSQVFAIVPAAAAAIPPLTLDATADSWYTIALVGSLNAETLAPLVIEQDTSQLTPGTARILFINALDSESSINLNRDGTPFLAEIAYPGYTSIVVDAGTYGFSAGQSDQTPLTELPNTRLAESYDYVIGFIAGDGGSPQLVSLETDPARYQIVRGELPEPGTVVDAVGSSDQAGELVAALESAGLTETLTGEGPFTVFAPAEFALDDAGSEDLAGTLTYHVVEGEFMTQDLVNSDTLTTLQGETLTVRVEDDNIFVNDAQIIDANIPATNGVVHLINDILAPPAGEQNAAATDEAEAVEETEAAEENAG